MKNRSGCKFCDEDRSDFEYKYEEDDDFRLMVWEMEADGFNPIYHLNVLHYKDQQTFSSDFEISFCPWCGRKLQ